MKITAQMQLASLKQNIGRKGVAFTLIELPVVIAIIAILAAMLLRSWPARRNPAAVFRA